jgi:cell wall-associated NlpC family hydrolase
MKRFIAIGAIALVMTSCSSSATADPKASAVAITQTRVEESTFLDDIVADAVKNSKKEQLNTVTAQLNSRVGKTWYVFSGSTPSGWDCSGLVVWFYEQLGIEVPHSANKQGNIGHQVQTPLVGDIVVWSYKGSSSYYHASIYIGNGKVIHAGFRPGTSTEVISLDDPSFKHSDATFIRVNW